MAKIVTLKDHKTNELAYPQTVSDAVYMDNGSTLEQYKESVSRQFNNYPNVTVTGTVTNLPDNEDIRETESHTLQLADRNNLEGMGYVILRKNKSFAEQVTQENTIYEIRYDFTLDASITVPANCVLKFNGGSISDNGTYTLTGTNTLLSGNIKCFVTIDGTFANNYLDITWFGAVGDDNKDNVDIINNLINICKNSVCDLYIPSGIFAIKTHHLEFGRETAPSPEDIDSDSSFISYNNITVFGEGRDSIIKSYDLSDNMSMYYVKDITIRGIHITSGLVEKQSVTWGTNTISVVNGKNIKFINVFATNAYYKAHTSPLEAYYDGGKGLTFQGRIFENIQVKGFFAENCAHGIDLEAGGDAFLYNPKSYVLFDDVVINKCAIGVYLQMDPNAIKENNDNQIVNGLISVNARTTNCLQALSATTLCGAIVNIQNVANESIDNLLLNGYGRPWLDTDDYSNVPNSMVSAYSAQIYTCEKCNITVSSYSKELNYGYTLIGAYNFGNKQIDCKDNTLTLSINDNVNIIKRKNAQSITDETKLKVFAQNGQIYLFKNSIFTINGCGNSKEQFLKFYKEGYPDTDLIIILDGKLSATNIQAIRQEFIYPGGRTNNILKMSDGCIVAQNLSASSGEWLTFGSINPNNNLSIAFNGNGDIARPALDSAPNVNISDDIAGSAAIPVRSTSYPFGVIGYLLASKYRTKGTLDQRPSPSSTDIGFQYYDVTLGRPIYWDGTSWADATGQTV